MTPAAAASPPTTRQWNPLPAIGAFLARFAAGKLAGFLASLLLVPLFVAAARATDGWPHLVLGLGVFCAFMALAQFAGALFAAHGRRAMVPLTLTSKFWLVIPLLALWPLLGLAGIADGDKQPMLTGVAIGVAAVMAVWVGWALVAQRRPGFRYHPGHLLGWRWYSRLSMNIGGLLGGLLAIGIVHR